MTPAEHIERCEREIQVYRVAAQSALTEADRYGLTWAEVDWTIAKQVYEEEMKRWPQLVPKRLMNKYLEDKG
jgi:hypothetical protein